MSTETKPQEATGSPGKPAFNINLEYLVPTLSAIAAALIHLICNKKEPITYVDVLLIISPSLPVLLGVVIKIISFMINWIANGTQNMNLGFIGTFIQKLNGLINFKSKINNTHSFDKDGRIIFHKFTVNIDISKKMAEWQKNGYFINYYNGPLIDSFAKTLISKFTGFSIESIFSEKNIFVNFYHEFELNNEKIIIYVENIEKNTYSQFFVSSVAEYRIPGLVYDGLCPAKYTENHSYYRISRIYNEYREELLHTIQMYKEKSIDRRKVCMNFCFAGPPGTSKTYAARAIAKELGRDIFEIDLSEIVFEEDFFELIYGDKTKGNNIRKSVFLLDEIDLMCPSREFDDKLIKNAEETRLTTFGVTKSNSNNEMIESLTDDSSTTEQDGFMNKQLLHKITLLQEDIKKLQEKMDKNISFNEWLGGFLQQFAQITLEFLYFNACNIFFTNKNITSCKTKMQSIHEYLVKTLEAPSDISAFLDEKLKSVCSFNSKNSDDSNTVSNTSFSSNKTPFTLRTLLNFISGGNTPDDLVIIATTNRPEKLDPALIRPGRLRLIEFKNLRKIDAVSMLLENYPNEKEAIENGLNEIGYEDYMSNGALLEAVMSSTSTLDKTLKTFQRELILIKN